jgi:hypothetical protein
MTAPKKKKPNVCNFCRKDTVAGAGVIGGLKGTACICVSCLRLANAVMASVLRVTGKPLFVKV